MPDGIQIGVETAYDRYPDVFYVAQRYSEANFNLPHILSFGCSTGEEPFCLAERYFPEATIVGIDISRDVLEIAKRNNTVPERVSFRYSTPSSIADNGPYDIIFAMSVLCRWPESRGVDDISSIYSFEEFETRVAVLDENLKHGGLLAIYNSNFNFLDCAVSRRYDVVLSKHVKTNGFVERFDRVNHAVRFNGFSDCIYIKRNDNISVRRVLRLLNEDGLMIGTLPATLTV